MQIASACLLLFTLSCYSSRRVSAQSICVANCHCIPEEYDPDMPLEAMCPDKGDLVSAQDYFSDPALIGFFAGLDLDETIYPAPTLTPKGCQPYKNLARPLGVKKCRPRKRMKSMKMSMGKRRALAGNNDRADAKERVLGYRRKERTPKVCVFEYDLHECRIGGARAYQLRTIKEKDIATTEGAFVTHEGSCGVCSNAADLVAWLSPGLDVISYQCGLIAIAFVPDTVTFTREQLENGLAETTACFQRSVPAAGFAGFSEDCAYLWASNAMNSHFAGCTPTCLAWLGDDGLPPEDGSEPPNDGTTCALHPCLECNERTSGREFAEIGGRTRRNSGILTTFTQQIQLPGGPIEVEVGLKRPCEILPTDISQVNPCT